MKAATAKGKYQDDCEDVMMAAAQTSNDKRENARKEREKKQEEDKQEASKQAMIDAGQKSRERRKNKK